MLKYQIVLQDESIDPFEPPRLSTYDNETILVTEGNIPASISTCWNQFTSFYMLFISDLDYFNKGPSHHLDTLNRLA